MKKVHQLLGLEKPVPGLFGIEIEAEGKNMREVHNKYWKTVDDGSLRGHYPDKSAEFVINKPITREEVEPALDSLIQELEGATFDFSFRTSVHVHVNVQDLTEAQTLNMIYAYLLLEEPLVNFCGRERKGNRFCLRVVDAEDTVEVLRTGFNGGLQYLMAQDPNAVRYSALNIASLRKYGSIEFRAMRGNIDKEVIKDWTEALYALKAYAITKKSPKEILQEYQALDADGFMRQVLGGLYQTFKYPRMVKEIQRSFSLTLDLPYAYKEKVEDAPVKGIAPKAPAAVRPRANRAIVDF
jgi:hypothetical protein